MNHSDNQLTYWGLALALLMAGVYLFAAFRKKRKPNLLAAIGVVIATVGLAGAVRLIGFVFTDGFKKAVTVASASPNGNWWSLTGEDGVFIVIGGIALGWASCQGIWQAFEELNGAGSASVQTPPTTVT